MINDLSVADTTLWKYIEDTTLDISLSYHLNAYISVIST